MIDWLLFGNGCKEQGQISLKALYQSSKEDYRNKSFSRFDSLAEPESKKAPWLKNFVRELWNYMQMNS